MRAGRRGDRQRQGDAAQEQHRLDRAQVDPDRLQHGPRDERRGRRQQRGQRQERRWRTRRARNAPAPADSRRTMPARGRASRVEASADRVIASQPTTAATSAGDHQHDRVAVRSAELGRARDDEAGQDRQAEHGQPVADPLDQDRAEDRQPGRPERVRRQHGPGDVAEPRRQDRSWRRSRGSGSRTPAGTAAGRRRPPRSAAGRASEGPAGTGRSSTMSERRGQSEPGAARPMAVGGLARGRRRDRVTARKTR